MIKRNRQSISIFLVMFVLACFFSGCSQELSSGGGTPSNALFSYTAVSAVALFVFAALLVFFIIKNSKMSRRYKDQAAILSAIYNALPDTVFTKDKNGVYTSCNHVLAKLHGRSEPEVIGKTTRELYRDEEQIQVIGNSDRTVLNEKKSIREQAWLTFEGCGIRFFETAKVPLIQQDGEVTGLLGIGRDMTDFRNLLDELSKTQKLTELMLDTIPFCCIMINKEYKCFACNSETTRLFKLKTKQEFIDQFSTLSPKYQPDGWLSAKLSHVYFEKAFEEGKCSFEWMYQLLDGTLIPALVTLVRVVYNNDQVVTAYVRDMREQVQMMDEIEKQNTLLKTLNHVSAMLLDPDTEKFENNLFDSLFIIAEAIDVDRVSIWKNYSRGGRLYCTLAYEWQSEDLPAVSVLPDISYEDNIPGCEEPLTKGKCLNIMARNMFPQTGEEPQSPALSAFAVPVFVHDKFWGFAAFDDRGNEHKFVKNEELILRSISRMIACTLIRNELTRNIRTTTSQLEVMVKEAHKASRAKSDFLAKMSHEIRTPMNAIVGMTELALREKELDASRRHIFTIKQASANLLSIINDILDITKIESGKMEILSDYYLFSSLMNDVISIIKIKLIDSQLRFTVNIDSNIPNELYGDETRIRQIFINLLNNAVKYTDEGFVSFTVTGTIIDEDMVNLVIAVKDSGRGIKQENIKKLFDDFSQFDTAKNRSIEGTGLGLAITWHILKTMGGDISVSSEYEKGSTFTVTLPQKFHSQSKLAAVKNPEEKSVLVYERRDIYANSIMATLENLGVSARLASNGHAFRKELESDSYSFIFLAPALYQHCKGAVSEFASTSSVVMLTEFGEAPPKEDFNILAMPVHCISVANTLNGIAEVYMYKENESLFNFTAPDARILIVDDIKTNLTVTEGLLLPYELQVDLCKSGTEAISAIKSAHYDLIFMDHWMLEMDGVEATKQIRAMGIEESNSYFTEIPIIALTANAISGTRDMFIKNGFNDFLAKPIDTLKLNSILERWVPKKKQRKITSTSEIGAITSGYSASPDAAAPDIPPIELFEIEGLNIDRGIAITGGSTKRYLEILNVFCDDGLEKTRNLKACLKTGNIPLYTIHVHALKSAASNIGAEELANAAKDLERAGKREDSDFIEANNPKFLADLKSLLNDIRSMLSSCRNNEKKADVSLDTKTMKAKLTDLKRSLETLDAHTMNTSVEFLLDMKLPDNITVVVQNISRRILMAEYDEASALTESLLQKTP